MTDKNENVPGSFRDPSGFVFKRNNIIFRQVNRSYTDNYDCLMKSGLYNTLVKGGLLIPHEESDMEPLNSDISYKVLKPDSIQFVSYPYEWCFSQLKDAALITLEIQKQALAFDMSLKDASAYNIQFSNGEPVLIDTLSFEKYKKDQPWVAYRQFCQHFLAPLALMSYTDVRLNQLFRVYIDGIPLDLASTLLPARTRFRFGLLSHIYMHAKSQKHFSDKTVDPSRHKISRISLLGIINSLEKAIQNLHWRPQGTEWANYYDDTNYSADSLEHKKKTITGFLNQIQPQTVWDLGANTGFYSLLAADMGIPTVSFDIDPACVEKNYAEMVRNSKKNILPLLLDLTNPSPAIGWENNERMSFLERGPVDMVMALALVHHLAISNNLPLQNIASFLSSICRFLIIEFIPKNDSQVQRLLSSREDIFSDYTQSAFGNKFRMYFKILDSVRIIDSRRSIYLMEKIIS